MRGKLILALGEWVRQIHLYKGVGLFRRRALDMWGVVIKKIFKWIKVFKRKKKWNNTNFHISTWDRNDEKLHWNKYMNVYIYV